MPVNITESNCCCCMACYNICPNSAISVDSDDNGFLYPYIDSSKCIECGLCEKVCLFKQRDKKANLPQKSFSLIHNDLSTLNNSTSGGAFTALSDVVLMSGGSVVGAVMDNDFYVKHAIAKNAKERDQMRGSVYVQSYIGTSYTNVKSMLEDGILVLFVGSPCQVGGLRGYLGKEYENLITIEFLCHGVPSNKFFQDFLVFLEEKHKKHIVSYSFRSKKYSWCSHGIEEVTFEDGKHNASKSTQAYNAFFHANLSLRPSCYSCKYRMKERIADITIGDFWGIEKLTGKKNRNGVSIVFVNTDKGMKLLESAAPYAELVEYPFEKTEYRISTKPPRPKNDTSVFWKQYKMNGFEGLIDKYMDMSLRERLYYFREKNYRKIFLGNHNRK